jgi:hypothetical protein
MASLNRVHASNTRSVLEQAFHLSWADVQAQDPFRDFSSDEALKASLRRKLFAMASSGMRDPELMREIISTTLSIQHDANEKGRR